MNNSLSLIATLLVVIVVLISFLNEEKQPQTFEIRCTPVRTVIYHAVEKKSYIDEQDICVETEAK